MNNWQVDLGPIQSSNINTFVHHSVTRIVNRKENNYKNKTNTRLLQWAFRQVGTRFFHNQWYHFCLWLGLCSPFGSTTEEQGKNKSVGIQPMICDVKPLLPSLWWSTTGWRRLTCFAVNKTNQQMGALLWTHTHTQLQLSSVTECWCKLLFDGASEMSGRVII